MTHLNGFEILILSYILHGCIIKVWDWNNIFHWIVWEFKIVDNIASAIVWSSACNDNAVKLRLNDWMMGETGNSVMTHLNGFEILILFYILHGCICEV